ncbi:lipase 1-like isoform X2 [Leptopilina boulardi]|nr:lipase 1-like isoform X2 [Leptopilina boulardi]
MKFIKEAGYYAEEHSVTTEDGYKLKMFRIPGLEGSKPVFLQHGLFASSNTWVISGKESLAFALSDKGYDVWMGNFRGNIYSKSHINLDQKDEEYWDYSFHEMGIYDLPAMINYITESTQQKLIYFGFSLGCTTFFVMASKIPEMSSKISVAILIAPVAYLSNMLGFFEKNVILRGVKYALNHPRISNDMFENSFQLRQKNKELILDSNFALKLMQCGQTHFKEIYLKSIKCELNGGSSLKNINHLLQQMTQNELSYYDYGSDENLKIYNQENPKIYNLTKIKIPIVLFHSKGDELTQKKDFEKLTSKLLNINENVEINSKKICHLDLVWGKNVTKTVNDPLFKILNKINKN